MCYFDNERTKKILNTPRINPGFKWPTYWNTWFGNMTMQKTLISLLEIVIQEVLWSIRGTYSAIWSPLSRMLNNILTLDQQWLLNRSDFPPNSWPWYRAWVAWNSPNYEWFPWSICNGCGMPAGSAYPSGHLVRPLFGVCLCSNCWDQIPRTSHVFTRLFTLNTPWYFLDFASYRRMWKWQLVSPRHFFHKKSSP